MNSREQRELLALQCRLVRLKIARAHEKQAVSQRNTPALYRFAHSLNTSRQSPLWRMARLPKRRRHRFVLTALLLAWQFWRN